MRLGHFGGLVLEGVRFESGGGRAFQEFPQSQAHEVRPGDEVVEDRACVSGQVVDVERYRLGPCRHRPSQNLVEQLLLVAEVGVDQPLVRRRGLGDPIHPGAGDAVGGEFGERGVKQPGLGGGGVAWHAGHPTK